MNVLKPFTTPEYLFRPRQILHRFRRALRAGHLNEFELVTMPWGSHLRVRPAEVIGANIWSYGIFDLVVSETLFRLLDPGETALDVGANIGQMSDLMRHRIGPRGKVLAFEPHPELFAELTFNIQSNSRPAITDPVELRNVALSDTAGEAVLDVGPAWGINRGMAKIVASPSQATPAQVRVPTITLDAALNGGSAAVCKIDVEGHERMVLNGATQTLENKRFREVVFEDLDEYPSTVHQVFLQQGFTLFSLHSGVWGPRLIPATEKMVFNENKDGKNFLATLDPKRALDRFKPVGWRVLRGG